MLTLARPWLYQGKEMKVSFTILLVSFLLFAFGCQEKTTPSNTPPPIAEPQSINLQDSKDKPVIVAFGDSLTFGYEVAPDQSYPAILEKILIKEGWFYHIVNAGISGDTTAGGVQRIDFVLQHQPEIVILELGANDALRGLPLFQIEQNLSAMIEQLQKNKITVVLAGMKIPPNYGRPYAMGFEQIYSTLAKRYQLALIPFFLEGVIGNPLLVLPDGLHPTARGYEIIAEQVYPILKPLLEK